jgi:hypothetical protein
MLGIIEQNLNIVGIRQADNIDSLLSGLTYVDAYTRDEVSVILVTLRDNSEALMYVVDEGTPICNLAEEILADKPD